MTIHIHPVENQEPFVNLALNLFMQAAAETILSERSAAKQQHPT